MPCFEEDRSTFATVNGTVGFRQEAGRAKMAAAFQELRIRGKALTDEGQQGVLQASIMVIHFAKEYYSAKSQRLYSRRHTELRNAGYARVVRRNLMQRRVLQGFRIVRKVILPSAPNRRSMFWFKTKYAFTCSLTQTKGNRLRRRPRYGRALYDSGLVLRMRMSQEKPLFRRTAKCYYEEHVIQTILLKQ